MSEECEICHRTALTPIPVALYRANAVGETPARWRCVRCMAAPEMAAVPPAIREIVEIIERDIQGRHLSPAPLPEAEMGRRDNAEKEAVKI